MAVTTKLKTNISKLRTKVLEIDREETIVCAALDELYGLVERLNQIDTDLLKKKEIHLIQGFANRFITKQNRNQLSVNELNNYSLLKDIFMATYIIKAAYQNIVEPAYRSEAELAILTENIENLKAQKEEYTDLLSSASKLKSLEDKINNAKETLDKIESIKEQVDDTINSISENLVESNSKIEEIKSINSESEVLVLDIKNNKNLIQEQLEKIAENQNVHESIINDLNKIVSNYKQQFNEQQIEIQNIIDDANRASMAGSFKKRKDEITTSIKYLDGFTYAVLLSIFCILWFIFTSSYNQDSFSPIHFFSRLPITLPLIWFAWLTSRKSAYLTRIREDYAYKYSSAMAFEGYKKQAQEISPELQQQLLDIAVNNLGENPIRLFDSKIKHTPIDYEEILQHLARLPSEKIEHVSDFLKKLSSK